MAKENKLDFESEKIIDKRFGLAEDFLKKWDLQSAMIVTLCIEDMQKLRMAVLDEIRQSVLDEKILWKINKWEDIWEDEKETQLEKIMSFLKNQK